MPPPAAAGNDVQRPLRRMFSRDALLDELGPALVDARLPRKITGTVIKNKDPNAVRPEDLD